MNCMTDLLQLRTAQRHKWRYLINLCGKELLLVTNREVELMKLNSSSSIIAQKVDDRKSGEKRKISLWTLATQCMEERMVSQNKLGVCVDLE